jgi:two-component system chemotaxis response regulator CheY
VSLGTITEVGIMPDLNARILVVDDFSTMRRIVKGILKRLGYREIDEAEDGQMALKRLKGTRYQLIICDWNMPVMTGLDLLKAVRSDEELKGIPFLMVTAEAKKENILEAIQAGVSNYIVKPFTEEVLSKKLEDIFKSRAA